MPRHTRSERTRDRVHQGPGDLSVLERRLKRSWSEDKRRARGARKARKEDEVPADAVTGLDGPDDSGSGS